MIHKAKKRSLLLLGFIFTGLLGGMSTYLRSNFSKYESVIMPVAHADAIPVSSCGASYTQSQCNVWVDSGYTSGGDAGCCDGGGCFPSGTFISTPYGKKEIQDIKVGDTVYGFDGVTGETMVSTVLETMKHSWDEVHTLSPLIIITHERGEITLTTNHPVFKRGSVSKEGYKDFENAGLLKVGDILTTESSEEVKIINIKEGPVYDFVYNLEVEGVHTYNASDIKVHNKGACGSGEGEGSGGSGGDGGGDGGGS